MSDRNDGGPAFPAKLKAGGVPIKWDEEERAPGMSLRDWLAGRAMQAMLHGDRFAQIVTAVKDGGGRPEHVPLYIANEAYAFADAMLAERKR